MRAAVRSRHLARGHRRRGRERVRRLTRVTPLVPAPALGRRTGADVWLKLENLQRTGSFKLRGAAARLAALALRAGAAPSRASSPPRPATTAWAWRWPRAPSASTRPCWCRRRRPRSSAPGIAALGAARRGRRARPTTRPRRRRAGAPPPIPGLVFVSAFDDDHVIAGNGGLLGARDPGPAPRRAGDRRARRRRRAGGRHRRRGGPARHQAAGRVARGELRHAPIARRGARLHDLRRRPDAGRGTRGRGQRAHLRDGARLLPRHRAGQRGRRSAEAIVYAYRTLGILCEASAAPALAALLEDASAIRGRRTVVVISGGNIEPDLLDQLLTGARRRRRLSRIRSRCTSSYTLL